MKRIISISGAIALIAGALVAAPVQANVIDPIEEGDWIRASNQSGSLYKISNDPLESGSRASTELTAPGIANPFVSQEWIYGLHADAANDVVWATTFREVSANPGVTRLHKYDFATNAWAAPITVALGSLKATHLASWGKMYAVGIRAGQFDWAMFEIDLTSGALTKLGAASSMTMQIWDDNGVLFYGGGNYISITKFDFNDATTPAALPHRALSMDEKVHIDPSGPDFLIYGNGNMAQIDNFYVNPITKTNLAQGWGGGGVLDIANRVSFTCNGLTTGVGSASNPFIIGTAAELSAMAGCSSIATYQLGSDIDMTGVSWSPMFSSGFGGVLNGAGHAIKNLSSVNSAGGGLFAKLVGGTVKNLRILDADIKGVQDTGIVASKASYATISGVSVTGEVEGTNTDDTVVFYTAGLVGATSGLPVTIKNSGFNGTVKGKHVGGILGWNTITNNGLTLANVYVRGEIFPVPTANQSWPNAVPGLLAVGNATTSSYSYSSAVRAATSTVDFSDRLTGTSGSSTNGFHETFTGLPAMTNSTAKTSAELKDISTYTGWDISAGYDSSKIWGLCELANDGYPFITASYATNPCVSPSSSTPAVAVVPLSNIQISIPAAQASNGESASGPTAITPGSEVAITGEAVETITQVEVGQTEAPILGIEQETLTFQIPTSLGAGVFDLTLVSSEFGTITHQDAITITLAAAYKLSWAKRLGNKVHVFSTLPNEFKIYVNGKELRQKPKGRLVGEFALSKGKNVIVIKRDGKQIRRIAYTKR